ncbi:MAG: hypothetical protein PHO89_08240 [Methylacidiphilaceae bacterium]|nr:hypothetical protein [Candidatus Methylacidiphilaceae bacterium]
MATSLLQGLQKGVGAAAAFLSQVVGAAGGVGRAASSFVRMKEQVAEGGILPFRGNPLRVPSLTRFSLTGEGSRTRRKP